MADLDGAVDLGGVAVRIDGDLTGLEAKVDRAHELADGVDKLTATVKIVADAEDLTNTINTTLAAIPRAGAQGADSPRVRVAVTLDDSTAPAQVAAMLGRIREEVARNPVVVQIQTATGSYVFGGAATPASVSSAPATSPRRSIDAETDAINAIRDQLTIPQRQQFDRQLTGQVAGGAAPVAAAQAIATTFAPPATPQAAERAAREEYAYGHYRSRATAAGANPERYDAEVDERVGQGSDRVTAARDISAAYRRTALAAGREADSAERVAEESQRVFNTRGRAAWRPQASSDTDLSPDDVSAVQQETTQAVRDRDYDRGGGSGLAGGGRSGRGGRGGDGQGEAGTNFLSSRGLGRLVGSATAGYAAIEAFGVATDFIVAGREEEAYPREVLMGLSAPGQQHDPMYDPQLRDYANALGRSRANQTRTNSLLGLLPFVGSRIGDALGVNQHAEIEQREINQQIQYHQAALSSVDQQNREFATQAYNPGEVLRVQANQRDAAVANDYAHSPFDAAVQRAAAGADRLSSTDRDTADRLDSAKTAGVRLSSESLTDLARAADARRNADPRAAASLQRAASYADMERQFGEQEAAITNPQERQRVQGENRIRLSTRRTEMGATFDEDMRQYTAFEVEQAGVREATRTQGEASRALGERRTLDAFDLQRTSERTASQAQAVSAIVRAGGDRDQQQQLIATAEAQFGKFTPDAIDPTKGVLSGGKFAGGASFDEDTAAQRKQIVEQTNAELVRNEAEAGAARLRAQHATFDAEREGLEALKRVAQTTGDEVTRASRVAVAQAQLDAVDRQQQEYRADLATSTTASLATSQAAVDRDPFAGAQANLAAQAETELRHANVGNPGRGDLGDFLPKTMAQLGKQVALDTQQQRTADITTRDYDAQTAAAEQSTAGQDERAANTLRVRQITRGVEQLPSVDAASPQAQQIRAAGLREANAALTADESHLTGHHGGAVVQGQTAGQAGAELLAGRRFAEQERLEQDDINRARAQINGPPPAQQPAGPPAPAQRPTGQPTARPVQPARPPNPRAQAYERLQAAEAEARKADTIGGDHGARDRAQAAVRDARRAYEATRVPAGQPRIAPQPHVVTSTARAVAPESPLARSANAGGDGPVASLLQSIARSSEATARALAGGRNDRPTLQPQLVSQ